MTAIFDRVRETTTTTGTGALTLAGAATGARTFNAAVTVGPAFPYVCAAGAEWEVGIGHLSAATTLVRDTILSSSNAGAAVAFSAGTKDVFLDAPAAMLTQAPQTLTYAASLAPVSLGNVTYRVTMTGALTLNVPTFPGGVSAGGDGDRIRLWLVASGADRVVTLNAGIKIPGSSVFTSPVTISSGQKAKLLLEYDASLNGGQWELTSFINGF